MFEPKASFCASRFLPNFVGNPEGAANRGRLSLLPFFGEAKKGSGPPGPVPACLHEVQTVSHHRSANRIESPERQPHHISLPPFNHPALILIKASRCSPCFRARPLHATHPMLIPYSMNIAAAAAIFSTVYRFHHRNRNRIQRLQAASFHNSVAVDTCQNSEQADT
jgi:hypothetical protein